MTSCFSHQEWSMSKPHSINYNDYWYILTYNVAKDVLTKNIRQYITSFAMLDYIVNSCCMLHSSNGETVPNPFAMGLRWTLHQWLTLLTNECRITWYQNNGQKTMICANQHSQVAFWKYVINCLLLIAQNHCPDILCM